jgi:cell division protein FtsQ
VSDTLPPNRRTRAPRGEPVREARVPLGRASGRDARAAREVIAALPDPIAAGDDSPVPGAATTTVSPPGPSPERRAAKPPGAGSRMLAALKFTAGVSVVLAASVAVAWGARRYVTTSPRFAVRTVIVDGAHKRSAAQIASSARVAVGANIFALDLTAASQSLTEDPWIAKATVTRKLPATIAIDVAEREVAALCAVGGDLYLATRDGELFKKLDADDPSDMPLVTGITAEQVARDRPGVVLAVKRVLDVADDAERSGLAKRYPIQELHLEKDGSLVVTIGKEAVSLHLGMPPYRDKIEEALRVLSEVSRRKASAAVVFLDNGAHPERVVVRMR